MTHTPQVVSFTAPTGSGKTIIMTTLIEDILFGTDQIVEQPEAIFVWLSDSPQLNAQSKDKIDVKADKIRFGQCVTIEEESFDMETLEEGHIYFLNTQKLGKKGKLSKAGDGRTWTIWETLENTAKQKADHLYFIIDEAHRGMQGTVLVVGSNSAGYQISSNSVGIYLPNSGLQVKYSMMVVTSDIMNGFDSAGYLPDVVVDNVTAVDDIIRCWQYYEQD